MINDTPTKGPLTPALQVGIDELCQHLAEYLNPAQISDIRRAFEFSAVAHEGQFRRNGDPYVTHPLAVAEILCTMHMDHQSIMAAMLHDVIEDTGVTKEELAEEFGMAVAELVDGVTKLTKVKFNSKAEAQAANFHKMMLAMTQDTRVILVKLADRLHNMRTLQVLSPEKRRRVATETLEIYAPIANRLGMNDFRIEFEDLGFKALHPWRAMLIEAAIRKERGHHKEVLNTLHASIEQRLQQEGLNARLLGREKHLYSIYLKMKEKHKSFKEIMDVYGFRVIVDNVDTCYRALGIMHNLFKPLPGRFKDYIAIPKNNGYQSLHTVLKGNSGVNGVHMEIQIRTEAMEAMANSGIAAHWLYKSDGFTNTSQARAREWMKSLLEIQKNAGNSLEFIENVKTDLFSTEVFVFTPKARLMRLPANATPVDFAYAVHSDVGNSCVAARIDSRMASLSTPLSNGQTVEIITAPGARPNPAWLNFVVTPKARNNIRHHLKDQQREESLDLGRRLLEKSLTLNNSSLAQIDPGRLRQLLNELGFKGLDDLLEGIGLGNHLPQIIACQLLPDDLGVPRASSGQRGIAIRGTEGLVVSYSRCCGPLPGDPIAGHVSAGRGIVIHRTNCNNLIAERRDNPDKCLPLRWAEHVDREFQSDLRIELANQRGLLAEIAREITDSEANIEAITMQEKGALHGVLSLSIMVRDRVHLARIIKRIRIIHGVSRVTRVRA